MLLLVVIVRDIHIKRGYMSPSVPRSACTRRYTASFHSTWLKIVSSWPTLAADHCDRLMSCRVPRKEHERVSETGVFPSLDRVSRTLCLSHYVTEISHKHSLRDFWRHFGLCSAVAHSDCCFMRCVQIFLLTYLITCSLCCGSMALIEIAIYAMQMCVQLYMCSLHFCFMTQ